LAGCVDLWCLQCSKGEAREVFAGDLDDEAQGGCSKASYAAQPAGCCVGPTCTWMSSTLVLFLRSVWMHVSGYLSVCQCLMGCGTVRRGWGSGRLKGPSDDRYDKQSLTTFCIRVAPAAYCVCVRDACVCACVTSAGLYETHLWMCVCVCVCCVWVCTPFFLSLDSLTTLTDP